MNENDDERASMSDSKPTPPIFTPARIVALALIAIVAAGGALAGAWLGFNAAEDLVALIAASVGAAVGGNLLLLALDIWWDRRAHDRYAESEALQALPATG